MSYLLDKQILHRVLVTRQNLVQPWVSQSDSRAGVVCQAVKWDFDEDFSVLRDLTIPHRCCHCDNDLDLVGETLQFENFIPACTRCLT
jgi:hypothetical protein